ncbi:MAG: hypothetical protein U0792_11115 [Gemmataceae bacterium]
MSDIYDKWGFSTNPFAQTPLPATKDGAALLVGRDHELNRIRTLMGAQPKLVTVEGRNGIGKTSIINVAAFDCLQKFLLTNGEAPALLPCGDAFQLTPDIDVDAFVLRVLHRVTIALKKLEEQLKQVGMVSPLLEPLAKWLQDPIISGGSLGASAFGFGVAAGRTHAANTGDGFKSTGFEVRALEMLTDLFPQGTHGGVVCVIDNLELMKTSKDARDLVESLRDRILSVPGLRWVLSGALGIVRGIGSTPRMSGYLHDPVEVGDIPPELSGDILQRRQDFYTFTDKAALPIRPREFQLLYKVLAGNIRDTLSEADNYCTKIALDATWSPGDGKEAEMFQEWLKNQCTRRLEAADRVITARPWKLFDDIIGLGGQTAPGDYNGFGFESQQAMRANVLKLEEANLIQSLRDEDDNRRKTILVTPNGWMVYYARSKGLDGLFADI